MEQSKKTMRHFYCRDALWTTFEQMAADFDCSVDHLINESMRYYARSKNYQGAGPAGGAVGTAPGGPRANTTLVSKPAAPAPAMRRPSPTPGTLSGRAVTGGEGAGHILYLVYQGQRFAVNKDQFIIGRGARSSDLAIKDGNISRKHAAVIRRNGTFYIKDLGSTNGIDYKGMRIDNKRIDEGDVFFLCDYELRFTYEQE